MNKLIASVIGFLFITQVFAQDLSDSLLLYYPFDGNAFDHSVNGLNGDPSGVIYTEDRFGNLNMACYFDGVDDFVDFPNEAILKQGLPVSFSFWIKYDAVEVESRGVFNTSFDEDISSGVFFTSQSITGKYALGFGDGTCIYADNTRRSYVSNSVIDTANWHHIAIVVFSNLDMSIYVDRIENGGVYSGTGGDLYYSESVGSIGRHDQNVGIPAYYFKGKLDDFRYWNRALIQDDVDELYDKITLDIEDIDKEQSDFLIFPNPVIDRITIQSPNQDITEIIIYNTAGQIVYQSMYFNSLDLSGLRQGLYVLKAFDNRLNERFSKKIIVR
ncbi:MAG: T9SS type A sorting domain-containing protein [Bacteroidales bacterium]|nr:T9SS type A sorting domain-containing protein [Bacteroidales bacterium]